MTGNSWCVHKFGGTSLANAGRYQNVATIIKTMQRPTAIVVSAMAGVTNTLIALVENASQRNGAYRTDLAALRQLQVDTIDTLITDPTTHQQLIDDLDRDLSDIEDILHALWLLRGQSEGALDLIPGYGELWSARLLGTYLSQSYDNVQWLDAREVIIICPGDLGPIVDWEKSCAQMNAWINNHSPDILVMTGFIASTPQGIPTTLGRNGSDFSGAILASLLDASSLSIWTDVDGVMSANPRQVPDALVLDELSYHEAMELAYFGAKVIHPATMSPAVSKNIPIFIKNTFNPDYPGTRIHLKGSSETSIKGIATIDNMALINLEGTGMIGVPGIASRLFSALREDQISVVLISQGSSEHSICFAIPEGEITAAKQAVEQAFFAEIHQGQIQTIDIVTQCSVLAVVGDKMAGMPGIAAKFFGALGKANINVRAIAQGSSERNISVVIDQKNVTRALRAVHAGFYLSNQTLSIGVIGPGNVGATLLAQLGDQAEHLRDKFKIDLRVRGLMTSSRMLLDDKPIDLTHWRQQFDNHATKADLKQFSDHINAEHIPHAVIVDCTSDNAIADNYYEWLKQGIHVITPNKKANTASLAQYDALRDCCRTLRRHYLYETTVGAGLPIIQTLRDLIQTGDDIISIEGIFSGTLSYLFNKYDGTKPFSEIVLEAQNLGYTEPDPRDDLSGMDVARKLVILAREMGLKIELSDVAVDSLVPSQLQTSSIDTFMTQLPAHDEAMSGLLQEAKAKQSVLRFVGTIDSDGNAKVALKQYPYEHPFARIQLTDNIVEFRTRRYHDNPLIVQGPGAGPDVTAGGIFADILRLATYLGATL